MNESYDRTGAGRESETTLKLLPVHRDENGQMYIEASPKGAPVDVTQKCLLKQIPGADDAYLVYSSNGIVFDGGAPMIVMALGGFGEVITVSEYKNRVR